MVTGEVDLPTYERLLLEALRSLSIDSGLATAPSASGGNTLTDASKNWAPNIHINRLVKIIKGQGEGQIGIIQTNSPNTLTVRSVWIEAILPGAAYMIMDVDSAQVLRDVLGGGANIDAANPLPVDTSPGIKTTETILTVANLAAAATSVIGDCTSIDLRNAPGTLALTVVATYNGAAVQGLRVHVRTSPDDTNWDSEDWDTWLAGFTAGADLRETENYNTDPLFLRVLIENLDVAQAITALTVIASVGV